MFIFDRYKLNSFNLKTIKLDRRFTAKHANQDLEFALGDVYIVDGAIKALKRSVGNINNLTEPVVDFVLRFGTTHALHDFINLVSLDRRWFGAEPTISDAGVLRTIYQASSLIFIWTRT